MDTGLIETNTRNNSKFQEVFHKLENMIVFCKIKPGTVITESQIATLLETGRTPVREALQLLAKDSLVTISRREISIPEISMLTQLKLLEVRRVILKLCVECSIERQTEQDRINLEKLLHHPKDMDDEDFLSWLKLRHRILAQSAKNEFIYEQLKSLQGLSYRFWFYYATKQDQAERKNLHYHLIESVLNHDREEAIAYVDQLIDYLEEFAKKRNVYF